MLEYYASVGGIEIQNKSPQNMLHWHLFWFKGIWETAVQGDILPSLGPPESE